MQPFELLYVVLHSPCGSQHGLKVVATCLKTAANTCFVYTFCFFLAVLDGLLSGMALIVELF